MFESLRSDQLSPLYLRGFFLFRVERLNSNSDFYSDFTLGSFIALGKSWKLFPGKLSNRDQELTSVLFLGTGGRVFESLRSDHFSNP